MASVPDKGYFAILRLYGPTEAPINKSWKPRDIERNEESRMKTAALLIVLAALPAFAQQSSGGGDAARANTPLASFTALRRPR